MIDGVTILTGCVLTELPKLASESIHCSVTSPPYWGLRDYGIPASQWPEVTFSLMAGVPPVTVPAMDCVHGLEPDPISYVAHEVLIFREVYRVLRRDGICWVNLGDSYATGTSAPSKSSHGNDVGYWNKAESIGRNRIDGRGFGLKPKDLVGIPWRVALALQADGWYLRSDVIWHKPNPMPESTTDRPTKAHEYLFLLAKSERYFYDLEASKEPCSGGAHPRLPGNVRPPKGQAAYENGDRRQRTKAGLLAYADKMRKLAAAGSGTKNNQSFDAAMAVMPARRNKRSVWTITTQPFKGAHFATFPPKLVEPCVLAGTSEKGCCPKCGAPWKRVVAMEKGNPESFHNSTFTNGKTNGARAPLSTVGTGLRTVSTTTVGWEPTCKCGLTETVPCRVLDPFGGSGTTAMVATQNGRHATIVERNPDYVKLAEVRIAQPAKPKRAAARKTVKPQPNQPGLFARETTQQPESPLETHPAPEGLCPVGESQPAGTLQG